MEIDLEVRQQSHAQAATSAASRASRQHSSATGDTHSHQTAAQSLQPNGLNSNNTHQQRDHTSCASASRDLSLAHESVDGGDQQQAGPLPMLASACPGWVCYAEKTHGSYILPYISTTKSPQVPLCQLQPELSGLRETHRLDASCLLIGMNSGACDTAKNMESVCKSATCLTARYSIFHTATNCNVCLPSLIQL